MTACSTEKIDVVLDVGGVLTDDDAAAAADDVVAVGIVSVTSLTPVNSDCNLTLYSSTYSRYSVVRCCVYDRTAICCLR